MGVERILHQRTLFVMAVEKTVKGHDVTMADYDKNVKSTH